MFGEGNGLLGTFLYTHVRGLLLTGRKRPLEQEDFPEICTMDLPSVINHKTREYMEPVLDTLNKREHDNDVINKEGSFWNKIKPTQPSFTALSLWKVILLVHWKLLLPPVFFKLFGDLFAFIPIICMKYLLISLSVEEETGEPDYLWDIRKGYIYSSIMFFAYCAVAVLLHQHHSLVIRAAMMVKYSIISLLFQQSMEISAESKQKVGGSGRLTTLVSSDSDYVGRSIWVGNYLWSSPMQIIISVVLLYQEIGWAVIGGFISMILLLAIQGQLGKYQSKLRTKSLEFTDARISLITQILIGIRVWKLNGWESKFGEQVSISREQELRSIRKIALITAILELLAASGPILITLVTFVLYGAFSSDPLTVSKAFTSLSLFNMLKIPLSLIPSSFVSALNSCAALDRIYDFLKADKLSNIPFKKDDNQENAVILKGDFFWSEENQEKEELDLVDDTNPLTEMEDFSKKDDHWKLSDIDISCKKGALTFIVGKVGAGKSTLIHSILGETKYDGTINVFANNIGFCAQHPWIFNDTLRENILFHSEFNEERYWQVIEACALQEDLDILPNSDMTEIGEHGINLSGGQQARISLARAVYRDCDLYLLDDIFSAVDAHVANHILNQCVLGPLLENKTRILVTHKLEYIDKADWVILLGSKPDLSSGILIQGEPKIIRESTFSFITESDSLQSYKSEESQIDSNVESKENDKNAQNDSSAQLIIEEEHLTGAVKFKVFFGYIKSFGFSFVSVALLILIVQIVTNLLLYWWLSIWSTDEYEESVWFYIQYYCLLSVIVILSMALFEAIWGIGAYYASKMIHKKVLISTILAPVSFFNATPVGRLLNRLSHDIQITDFQIAKSVSVTCSRVAAMLGVVVLLCVLVPYLLFLLVPMLCIYFALQRFYSASSREIRRLDKISKSPIYSYLEETQSGLSTVRAYQLEDVFSAHMFDLISKNQTVFWTSHQINRWLAVRLEAIGAFVTSAVSFTGVLFSSSLGSGTVGLMISQSLSLSSALNWTIRVFVDLESQLTSVERLLYSIENTPKEETEEMIENYQEPPEYWPRNGRISFNNVSVRYRDDLPLVLENFTLEILPHEKIGVCGRTGAGKSSLILCLFRIMELYEGSICIDDIDISKIHLSTLRTRLSIIPQSPILFPGSIRTNLDPFDNYSDVEIWNVLEKVKMKEYISNQKDKLETSIIEWGDNFSTGQRQLLCLARAILRNTSILVLDEATASVDPETDKLIQTTIREEFKNCTVLTIAHRLSSIVDSDRILVLEKGNIKELGKPEILLKDPNSSFTKMLNSSLSNTK